MIFNLKKKTLYLIAAVVILALAVSYFYLYPVFFSKNQTDVRDSQSTDADLQKMIPDADDDGPEGESTVSLEEQGDPENSENPPDETGVDSEASFDPLNTDSANGDVLAHITSQHCRDECEAFANNLVYFEYCEQVCSLSPVKDVSASDCGEEEGIRKDYCLKDLAINKLDSSICDQIDDANIKNTCKNRILQEIIESQ